MFDPKDGIDLSAQRQPQPRAADRPLPKPISDPQTQLWLPADLVTENRTPKTSNKEHIKHIGNFIVPVLGIVMILAVFGYVASILIGVYQ